MSGFSRRLLLLDSRAHTWFQQRRTKPCGCWVSLLSPLGMGATLRVPSPCPLTLVLDMLLQEGLGVTQHPLRRSMY